MVCSDKEYICKIVTNKLPGCVSDFNFKTYRLICIRAIYLILVSQKPVIIARLLLKALPAGVYFYRLSSQGFSQTKRLILVE
jgi:hypothetical protein